MRIGNIGAAITAQKPPEQKAPPPKPANVASSAKAAASSIATATEEAIETPAQTKTEAASGDQQARRLMARDAATQQLRAPTQNGVGGRVNTKA